MNKIAYILFFTLFGFFFNPINTYACGSTIVNIEKSCCSKMKKSAFHEKGCADKENHKSCDGSCNSSNCHFAPVFSSTISEFLYTIPKKVDVIYSKQSNFFYLEKNTSLNYFAIWSPPKIG